MTLSNMALFKSLKRGCEYNAFFEVFFIIGLVICPFSFSLASAEVRPTSPHEPKGHRTMNCDKDIDRLLNQMTIDEKLGQMQLLDGFEDGRYKPEHRDLAEMGLLGGVFNVRSARITNDLQKAALEKSRLKIPLLFAYDVLHGYRTIFPIPLGLASTWNPQGISLAAKISAQEARAAGIKLTFAPMLDIARDPRWGRIAESPGEDPYLGSVIANAWVTGFHSTETKDEPATTTPDKPYRLQFAACAKHFVAYGAAEGGRDYNTVDISDRTLREIYLPPFRAAVEANVNCVMTAASEINAIPSVINDYTINSVLRKEWQYSGLVISDFNSLFELQNHGVAASPQEATKLALDVGLDIDLVSGYYLKSGVEVAQKSANARLAIDRSVRRILALKASLGLFENPFTDQSAESASLLSPHAKAVARELAAQSFVLLKNDRSLLPLVINSSKIALLGPHAQSKADLLGPWSADGKESEMRSLEQSLKSRCSGADCILTPPDQTLQAALDTAKHADIIILALGESREWSGEAASRSSIELPKEQLKLANAIANSGKPSIAVVFSGRPLAIPQIAEQSSALIQAWFPGTMGAEALTDILFGDVNPSGKLPVSIPRSTGQIPVYYNHKPTGRPFQSGNRYTSKYIDEKNDPFFPFGFGLSYTTFKLSDLNIRSNSNSLPQIQVTLENTGKRVGIETVQLYVRRLNTSVTTPIRELRGFFRAELKPLEKRVINFKLNNEGLSYLNRDLKSLTLPRCVIIEVGRSSVPELSKEFCTDNRKRQSH